jgi:hypothetical protein
MDANLLSSVHVLPSRKRTGARFQFANARVVRRDLLDSIIFVRLRRIATLAIQSTISKTYDRSWFPTAATAPPYRSRPFASHLDVDHAASAGCSPPSPRDWTSGHGHPPPSFASRRERRYHEYTTRIIDDGRPRTRCGNHPMSWFFNLSSRFIIQISAWD